MSSGLVFLTVEQVLRIHQRMILEFGGTPELRDRGLLESALAMPQARFGGKLLHDGLGGMAAAYLFHLCKNHPFMDGNKRTALASAEVFLELNHARLTIANLELERIVLGVAEGSVSKEILTDLFRKRTRVFKPGSPRGTRS